MHSPLCQTASGGEAGPAMIKISGKSEIGVKRIFLRVTDTIRHHDVSDNSQLAPPITAADTTSPYMLAGGTYKLIFRGFRNS